MADKIGLPNVSGMTGALKNAGIGAIGGLLYQASLKYLGNGLPGALVGIGVAGATLKDGQGEIVATVLGERVGESLIGMIPLPGGSSAETTSNFTAI